MTTQTTIDGIVYDEVDESDLSFGNACNHCNFRGKRCYDRLDFSCHGDARHDGRNIVFKLHSNSAPCTPNS